MKQIVALFSRVYRTGLRFAEPFSEKTLFKHIQWCVPPRLLERVYLAG